MNSKDIFAISTNLVLKNWAKTLDTQPKKSETKPAKFLSGNSAKEDLNNARNGNLANLKKRVAQKWNFTNSANLEFRETGIKKK